MVYRVQLYLVQTRFECKLLLLLKPDEAFQENTALVFRGVSHSYITGLWGVLLFSGYHQGEDHFFGKLFYQWIN